MRSLVKALVITVLVGFVGAQFLPDVIHVPKGWPRFPKIEVVHESATPAPAPAPAPPPPVVAAPPDTTPPPPPVAVAPPPPKRVVKHAKPKLKRETLPEEDGWNATEPTAMIVPVKITTSVELSGDSERTPVPPAPEPKAGEEWPVVCGQVVDAKGVGVEGASVTIESTDITEHTDKNGRFCLASPTRKVTLLVGVEGRDPVRYAAELEGRNTQVSVTLE